MNARHVFLLVAAILYGAWRLAPHIDLAVPQPPAVSVPFESIGKLTSQLTAEDRAALSETYLVLSRAVAADPATDPVFLDTAAVRRAHRAALLVVWKGLLNNKTGEVPGLKDALEKAVNDRIGTSDIPMNPALRGDTAKAFSDVAASIR
jgi:hypothetical protein